MAAGPGGQIEPGDSIVPNHVADGILRHRARPARRWGAFKPLSTRSVLRRESGRDNKGSWTTGVKVGQHGGFRPLDTP
jgi:hypothetical protein